MENIYFTSTDISDGIDFLEHHGILGMHWGDKNGPPYPLDSSISTGKRLRKKKTPEQKHAEKKQKQQQSYATWRKKVLSNPKLLAKNTDHFTQEELEEAMQRFKRRDWVASYAYSKDAGPKKLSLDKKMMARNEKSLYKNRHKFSPAEMDIAVNQLQSDNKAASVRNEAQKLNTDRMLDRFRLVDQANRTTGNVLNTLRTAVGLAEDRSNLKNTISYNKLRRLKNKKDMMDTKYDIENFDRDKAAEWSEKVQRRLGQRYETLQKGSYAAIAANKQGANDRLYREFIDTPLAHIENDWTGQQYAKYFGGGRR